jgi:hypothetical protein
MSQLYATIDSDTRQKPATSRGNERIEAHVRGWDHGIKVIARVEDGEEVFQVYTTGGSHGWGKNGLIGEFVVGDDRTLVKR